MLLGVSAMLLFFKHGGYNILSFTFKLFVLYAGFYLGFSSIFLLFAIFLD